MKFTENPSVGSGKSAFLKLKSGDSVKGVLRGDIAVHYIIWQGNKSVESTKENQDAKFRFKVNLVLKEGNEYVAKVWEQGATVYNALKALSEDYDLTQTVIKITRIGQGTETEYQVFPMPQKLDDATLSLIAKVPLNDLKSKGAKASKQQAEANLDWGPLPEPPFPGPEFEDSETIPF